MNLIITHLGTSRWLMECLAEHGDKETLDALTLVCKATAEFFRTNKQIYYNLAPIIFEQKPMLQTAGGDPVDGNIFTWKHSLTRKLRISEQPSTSKSWIYEQPTIICYYDDDEIWESDDGLLMRRKVHLWHSIWRYENGCQFWLVETCQNTKIKYCKFWIDKTKRISNREFAMGITNLMRLIEETVPEAISSGTVAQFRHKTIAIDASIYVYKCMAQRPMFIGRHIVRMIRLAHWMRRRQMKPIFVFDGQSRTQAKRGELNHRRELKRRNIDRYEDVCSAITTLENIERRCRHIKKLSRYTKVTTMGREAVIDSLLFTLEDCEATFLPRSLVRQCVDSILSDQRTSCAARSCASSQTVHPVSKLAQTPLEMVLGRVSMPQNNFNWINIDANCLEREQLFATLENICRSPFLDDPDLFSHDSVQKSLKSERLFAREELPKDALESAITFVALHCGEKVSNHLIECVNRCWSSIIQTCVYNECTLQTRKIVLPLLFAQLTGRQDDKNSLLCAAPSDETLVMKMDTFLKLHSSKMESQHAQEESSESFSTDLTEIWKATLTKSNDSTENTNTNLYESANVQPERSFWPQQDPDAQKRGEKIKTNNDNNNDDDNDEKKSNLFYCIAKQEQTSIGQRCWSESLGLYPEFRKTLASFVANQGFYYADSALMESLDVNCLDEQQFITQKRLPQLHKSVQCKRKQCIVSLTEVSADCCSLPDGIRRLKKMAVSLESQTVRVHYDQVDEVKKALVLLGERVVEAEGEAEQFCAQLCLNGIADAVMSDDTDVFPFGATVVLRKCHFEDNAGDLDSFAQCIDCRLILRKWNVSRAQLVDLCIMAGSDFCPGVKDVPLKRLLEMMCEQRGNMELILNLLPFHCVSGLLEELGGSVSSARRLFLEPFVITPQACLVPGKRQIDKLRAFLREQKCLQAVSEYLPTSAEKNNDSLASSR